MSLQERRRSTAEVAEKNWISIHVTHEGQVIPRKRDSGPTGVPRSTGNAGQLFEHAAARPTLAESFPRLTVVAIAFALVAFTVATEIEYLRVAGYYWR
jgi:hypothetical protein